MAKILKLFSLRNTPYTIIATKLIRRAILTTIVFRLVFSQAERFLPVYLLLYHSDLHQTCNALASTRLDKIMSAQ